MPQKILYVLQHYALLALFFLAILGWGRCITGRLFNAGGPVPRLSRVTLQATAGLGLVTILLCFVAAIGQLKPVPLLAVLTVGIALALPSLLRAIRNPWPGRDIFNVAQLGKFPSILIWLAAAAFLSNALVRPLTVPLGWDEVAYHLPTARAWAESGALVVTDWLRYPLFPFNMELLYAGAMVLADDITAHLIHALVGLLAAALAFSIARVYMPLAFSALASVLLVYSIREPMQTADVELGLTLYLFSAFAALGFSHIAKQRSLVFLSAWFVGLALGTKYQAMFYLPALAIGLLMIERDFRTLALAACVAILAGCFWYVRNVVVSNDPIHPIGGAVFGYWLWNADDIRRQFLDLDGARGLPPWYLLPGIASLFFWRSSAPAIRGCMITTGIAVVTWLAASGYPRYLMPMYPMLAILSSYFLFRTLSAPPVTRLLHYASQRLGRNVQLAAVILLLIVVVVDWGKSTKRDIRRLVLPYSAEHTAMLEERYPGFELLNSLDKPLSGALYQLGFEDEIYYLGTPVLGDHFGKARYADVLQHAGNPAELSSHLRSIGAAYLMVNRVRYQPEFYSAAANNSWPDYFDIVQASPRAVLFRVKEAGAAGG